MAQLPQWQPLDTGVPIPKGVGPGRIVALVASKGAVQLGWAGKVALEIARAWSGSGEKVVLADGALHYPTLHTEAQTENVEGLSDAALFGLSVRRVARPVDGGAFFLIPAGTAVADANAVAGSARWKAWLGGFVEAGVTLILFVRDGESGAAAFMGSASDVIVLSNRNEKAPTVVRGSVGKVRSVTGPGSVAPTSDSELRPPHDWTASAPQGRRRVVMLAVVLIVVIFALLVAFGIIPIPGLSPETPAAASLLPYRGSAAG